ncbi:redox-sensitive transcriptional activator SoxR [Thalassotalea sp. LPB0316]|uniref:redox-sensitive transcriptional activator SoxR n=1 Tax=Thalassotalea sp. LPB0316 TaxID=2769490 RepID=UPI001866C69E|nr:redox-sensitive transcriptional activator SoxR [Thalassotalea sp. LPB0316]QOL24570.1 redox-sensitive transcriptional activator SoxR [Thalassotalea sp. LPB0316]
MNQEANLSVGKVAKRCGIKVSTLHFYEEKGLIRSWRNQGNQRRYKPDVMRRISVIKAAQKMGVSLDDVQQALSSLPNNRTPDKQDWQKLSKRWHQLLDNRIKALEVLRDSISSCIGCGCLSLSTCPIYNPEDELSETGEGAIILQNDIAERINDDG